MSKMGQELDKRLDENKYEMYEACKQALRTFEARGISPTDDRRRLLEKALAKAEGK